MSSNTTPHAWAPSLYDFLDYRRYLRAYYEAGKAHTRHISFRYLSRRAGFRSPNFIKLVMDGERNLSEEGAEKIAQALELRSPELEFFRDMVLFTQSQNHEERNEIFTRLSHSKQFRAARRIDQGMFEYLSHWYYPAIREMVARKDFDASPAWIASQLFPPITPEQAERAFALLLSLELVMPDPEHPGGYVRHDPHLTTGHEVSQLGVGNYHRQMTSLAMDSIAHVRASERHLSAMTMCIDAELFEALREKILAFRESVVAQSEQSETPDRVYQLNLQFFPLSRVSS